MISNISFTLKNYFYENWNKESENDLIQYTLPTENIESIQKIKSNEANIYNINLKIFLKNIMQKTWHLFTIKINQNLQKFF